MNAVIEVDVIGQIMDAVPLQRVIAGETLADGREHWRVVPNLCVTRHAGVGAWQTSKGRLFDGGVTITAIDAVIANVMFMAERHRLIQRNIDIGRVGRPIDFGGGPTGYANEHDDTEYRYTRVNIRPRRKKLGHENLRFVQPQGNRVRKQTGTPAMLFPRPSVQRQIKARI